MKCGLICARSARTSASISRVREASSSASSSWPETHAPPRRRRGPGRRWHRARGDQGADDAVAAADGGDDGRPDRAPGVGAGQLGGVEHRRAAGGEGCCGVGGRWAACTSAPSPSQASTLVMSVRATAGVPSSVRRCLTARRAPVGVRPSRRCGEASPAVCSVGTSPGRPGCPGRGGEAPGRRWPTRRLRRPAWPARGPRPRRWRTSWSRLPVSSGWSMSGGSRLDRSLQGCPATPPATPRRP